MRTRSGGAWPVAQIWSDGITGMIVTWSDGVCQRIPRRMVYLELEKWFKPEVPYYTYLKYAQPRWQNRECTLITKELFHVLFFRFPMSGEYVTYLGKYGIEPLLLVKLGFEYDANRDLWHRNGVV